MKRSTLCQLLMGLLYTLFSFSCVQENKSKETIQEDNTVSYSDQHRPQFHFSPQANWMNDPNGMVYIDGAYHLFYQYYPDSTVWGPMHWGHAVSSDLVHWEHLPIALYPDSLGYIFSGSAVYDKNNTSGLGNDENPPLVAIYTYHSKEIEVAGGINTQSQAIAYSLDKGKSWQKYSQNPVLENPGIIDFRDPKVFWLEKEKKWLMALAVKDRVHFYSSGNLIDWRFESEFGENIGAKGGVWECPDLFQLNDQWVLLLSINPGGPVGGSATQYFIGDFDGTTFTAKDDSVRWLDMGADNYAGVTWNNVPKSDGRKLFIGWMSNWNYAQVVPTETWRSAMTLPRVLSLSYNGHSYYLKSNPVRELKKLRKGEFKSQIDFSEAPIYLEPQDASISEFEAEITYTEQDTFTVTYANSMKNRVTIHFVPGKKQIVFDRSESGDLSFSDKFGALQLIEYPFKEDQFSLRIFKDIAAIEIFIDNGDLAITNTFFPKDPLNQLSVGGNPDSFTVKNYKFYPLQSIWNKK